MCLIDIYNTINGTDIVPLLFIISPENNTVLMNIGKDRHKPFKSVFIVPRGVLKNQTSRCSKGTYIHFYGFGRDCSWDQWHVRTPLPRSQLQSSRELLLGGV